MPNVIATGIALLAILPALAHAQDTGTMPGKPGGEITQFLPHNPAQCAPDGVANGGYDLVSYRHEDGPRFGSAQYSADHGGLVYVFESAENRNLFVGDPERYLPAYSGWCAVTLALGRLSCPDYNNFKIEDDRLLLFELTGFTNGRTLWNTSPSRYGNLADDNYSLVLDHE